MHRGYLREVYRYPSLPVGPDGCIDVQMHLSGHETMREVSQEYRTARMPMTQIVRMEWSEAAA